MFACPANHARIRQTADPPSIYAHRSSPYRAQSLLYRLDIIGRCILRVNEFSVENITVSTLANDGVSFVGDRDSLLAQWTARSADIAGTGEAVGSLTNSLLVGVLLQDSPRC
jgi:hypothetical protein